MAISCSYVPVARKIDHKRSSTTIRNAPLTFTATHTVELLVVSKDSDRLSTFIVDMIVSGSEGVLSTNWVYVPVVAGFV